MDKDIYYDAKIAKQKSLQYEFEEKIDKIYREIKSAVHFGNKQCFVHDIFENIFSEDVIDYLKSNGYKLESYRTNQERFLSYRISWE